MALEKKAWQDHLQASFGQEDEGARSEADGLMVGGYYGTAALSLDNGDFGRLQLTSAGAVKVDLVGTEPVVVQIGTITIGTLTNIGTVVGLGTVSNVAVVHNAGTIASGSIANVAKVHNAGTVAVLPDLPGGTVDNITQVDTIAAGTQNTLGTVSKVLAGSVRVTVGTITAGTLTNVGTVVGLGTIANIAKVHDAGTVVSVGTVPGVGSISNIAALHTAGTVTQLPDLPGGTVDNITQVDTIAAGTLHTLGTVGKIENGTIRISVGTIAAGTVKTIEKYHPDKFGTVITSGTSDMGTIKALVSGSAIYVTDLIVASEAANTVVVGDGGTSTPLYEVRMIANKTENHQFRTPLFTSSGSALIYKGGADDNITITAQGFVE